MSKTVILPYDPNWEALIWAKTNCRSYITNQGIPRSDQDRHWAAGSIEYFFADEKDAMMFALKWS